MIEAAERKRRVKGKEDVNTLNSEGNLAQMHLRMGNPATALALCREASETSRRVLGQHKITHFLSGNLGVCLCDTGDRTAGIGLLEGAITGHVRARSCGPGLLPETFGCRTRRTRRRCVVATVMAVRCGCSACRSPTSMASSVLAWH